MRRTIRSRAPGSGQRATAMSGSLGSRAREGGAGVLGRGNEKERALSSRFEKGAGRPLLKERISPARFGGDGGRKECGRCLVPKAWEDELPRIRYKQPVFYLTRRKRWHSAF